MQSRTRAQSSAGASQPDRIKPDAGIATLWLGFYLLILGVALARPAVSAAGQLASLF